MFLLCRFIEKYPQGINLFTSALEVEAVLVECTVNKFVSVPAEHGIVLTKPVAVDILTS